MNIKSVEPDGFLSAAGECFMFLLWCETAMCDLVVLKEGGEEMQKCYSNSFGKESLLRDFSRRRLELGVEDFRVIKDRFLCHWPQSESGREIRDAIERVVIWRNALGHANVQHFRGYLLYTPNETAWKRIRKYTRCEKCHRYFGKCGCSQENYAEPHSITVREETLRTIYEDIRAVDIECLYPAAVSLDVAYQGVAWPT